MRTLTSDDVIELLRAVPEPCSILMGATIDIVDMGLVEHVSISAGHVEITLVLTDTSCVHFCGMSRYICDVVGKHPDVDRVDVHMSTTTVWTPDRRQPL